MRSSAGLLLALLCCVSCRKEAPVPPAPVSVTPLPELPFEVTGRVLEGEVPVAGATVVLVGDRVTWEPRLSFTRFREDDDGRDCRRWPLACHGDADRTEVLRQLDAGTLGFPQHLATTTTDAQGRFVLRASSRDAFVVAWRGGRLSWREGPLRRWGELDFALPAEGELHALRIPEGATTATLVNPFAREVSTLPLDGGEVFVRERTLVWTAPPPPRHSRTVLELRLDGGLVDGVVDVDCGPDSSQRLRTDGGRVEVWTALRGTEYCRVEVSAGAERGDTALFAGERTAVATFRPRRALTVTLAPPSGEPAEVSVDFPIDPNSIAGIGTRGGGTVPGFGRFDGGVARFDRLAVRAEVAELEVRVRRPGFVRGVKRFAVTPEAQVEFVLTPVPGLVGTVVDEEGRVVPELMVDARPVDAGAKGGAVWNETDERGRYRIVAEVGGPHELSARHLVLGSFAVSSDAVRGPVVLRRGPAVELALTADGGALGRERVSVSSEQDSVRAWTDDAGLLRLCGLTPGAHALEVGRDPEHLAKQVVVVPDGGMVRASVTLP